MIHIKEGLVVKILKNHDNAVEVLVNINEKTIRPLHILLLQGKYLWGTV